MQTNSNQQRGGVILGVIIGVLVGLGVALGVAMYIMKVPAPFSTKNAPRSAEQDKVEAKKNKDWDPNAALSGVKPVDPNASAPAAPATSTPAPVTPARAEPVEAPKQASPAPATNAAATTPAPVPKETAVAPLKTADEFVVQLGAFGSKEEAGAQRAKLTLAGFDVHIEERDQSGRAVYRIRTPSSDRATADKLKERAGASGFDALVVKIQK